MGKTFNQVIKDVKKEFTKMKSLVKTRFPPEPSGYLHIGHLKAILINLYTSSENFFKTGTQCKETLEFPSAAKKDYPLLFKNIAFLNVMMRYLDKIHSSSFILNDKALFFDYSLLSAQQAFSSSLGNLNLSESAKIFSTTPFKFSQENPKKQVSDLSEPNSPKSALLLRFDDTNPSNVSTSLIYNILSDLRVFNIPISAVSFSSQYKKHFEALCVVLIDKGAAYVDLDDAQAIKTKRMDGIPSSYRDLEAQTNKENLEQVRRGQINGCVRLKVDMKNPNKCLRDPVIFRIGERNAYRTTKSNETEAKGNGENVLELFPCYDLVVAVLDWVEGIDLAMRSDEYKDRRELFEAIIRLVCLPHVLNISSREGKSIFSRILDSIDEEKVKGLVNTDFANNRFRKVTSSLVDVGYDEKELSSWGDDCGLLKLPETIQSLIGAWENVFETLLNTGERLASGNNILEETIKNHLEKYKDNESEFEQLNSKRKKLAIAEYSRLNMERVFVSKRKLKALIQLNNTLNPSSEERNILTSLFLNYISSSQNISASQKSTLIDSRDLGSDDLLDFKGISETVMKEAFENINTKGLFGWWDPRAPTLRGLLLKGFEVKALFKFIGSVLFSTSENLCDWNKVRSINKKLLEGCSLRVNAIPLKDAVFYDVFEPCLIRDSEIERVSLGKLAKQIELPYIPEQYTERLKAQIMALKGDVEANKEELESIENIISKHSVRKIGIDGSIIINREDFNPAFVKNNSSKSYCNSLYLQQDNDLRKVSDLESKVAGNEAIDQIDDKNREELGPVFNLIGLKNFRCLGDRKLVLSKDETYSKALKVNWVSANNPVKLLVLFLEELLKKKALDKDDKVEDFLEEKSWREEIWVGEESLRFLNVGSIVQIMRVGIFKIIRKDIGDNWVGLLSLN